MLGIGLALAPFSLLTGGSACSFAVGGGFPGLCRGLGTALSNLRRRVGCFGSGGFDILFKRGRVRQARKRPLRDRDGIAGCLENGLEIFRALGKPLPLSGLPRKR